MTIKMQKLGGLFNRHRNPRTGSVMNHRNAQLTQEIHHLKTQLSTTQQDLARAQEHAMVDNLTGLPNRRAFDHELVTTISRFLHDPRHEPVVIGFIDLDGLKTMNDQYGHEIGDQMLQNFADKTSKYLRQGDTLYRQGGDEFLLIAETRDPQQFKHKIKLFQNLCDLPEQDQKNQTRFSIGYAVLDQRFLNTTYVDIAPQNINAQKLATDLVTIADQAMYHNKHHERQRGRSVRSSAPEL